MNYNCFYKGIPKIKLWDAMAKCVPAIVFAMGF